MPGREPLTEIARQAGARGEFDIAKEIVFETGMSPRMAAQASVAVVTGTNVTPVSAFRQQTIGTWYEVMVDRMLSEGTPATVGPCEEIQVPAGIRGGAKTWALWLPGGTIVVDGVRIAHRYEGEQGHVQPGATYLVFGRHCGVSFQPLYGREGVFLVEDNHRLRRLRASGTNLTDFIEKIGTVEGVLEWLRKSRQGRAEELP